ncbi:MAG TPA: VWA domain-containing protein [Pyrinomonadaceae bacterium]
MPKLTAFLLLLFVPTSFFAQTPPKKHKDFGSSLKKLQWDPAKKEASVVESARTTDDDVDVIKVETSLVAWDVLVADAKGNPVQGLTADDFQVTEDDQPQTVGHFMLGDSKVVPRTIVLIIDYSGSQLPYIRNSIDAAKLMVDKLAPQDRMAIVTDDVELLVDFTTDKELLKKKLESLFKKTRIHGNFIVGKSRSLGKSDQYSSLLATLNELFDDSDQRPIIVFQTDGDQAYRLRDSIVPREIPPDLPDETREAMERALARGQFDLDDQASFSLADIYRAAEKSRATIYTVVPGLRLVNVSPEEQVERTKTIFEKARDELFIGVSEERKKAAIEQQDRTWRPLSPLNLRARANQAYKVQLALAALSLRTGGWTEFLESPEQASAIYARIFDDITKRYVIGYYPTNKTHDGTRRKISVTIKNHPEYAVLGRKAYYAPRE